MVHYCHSMKWIKLFPQLIKKFKIINFLFLENIKSPKPFFSILYLFNMDGFIRSLFPSFQYSQDYIPFMFRNIQVLSIWLLLLIRHYELLFLTLTGNHDLVQNANCESSQVWSESVFIHCNYKSFSSNIGLHMLLRGLLSCIKTWPHVEI